MLNNANSNNCGYADEILSYIYDEISRAERHEFESHLVDCTPCTDEFAEISLARFSVFEWHKEEFAHLSTPEIIIPYEPISRKVEEAHVGFLSGLRGLFGARAWPVAVAVSVLLVLGVGVVVLNFPGSEQQIAANVNVPPVAPAGNLIAAEMTPDIKIEQTRVNNDVTESPKITPSSHDIRMVKVADNRQPRPDKHITAETQRPNDNIPQKPVQRDKKAPVLSNFEDNEDKSPRLSDLFEEEVGAKL